MDSRVNGEVASQICIWEAGTTVDLDVEIWGFMRTLSALAIAIREAVLPIYFSVPVRVPLCLGQYSILAFHTRISYSFVFRRGAAVRKNQGIRRNPPLSPESGASEAPISCD